jgi:hypothetical protein
LSPGFLTAGIGANVDQLHRSDAAGNGMADAFAYLFTVVGLDHPRYSSADVRRARRILRRYSGVATAVRVFSSAIAAPSESRCEFLTESRAEGAAAILLAHGHSRRVPSC